MHCRVQEASQIVIMVGPAYRCSSSLRTVGSRPRRRSVTYATVSAGPTIAGSFATGLPRSRRPRPRLYHGLRQPGVPRCRLPICPHVGPPLGLPQMRPQPGVPLQQSRLPPCQAVTLIFLTLLPFWPGPHRSRSMSLLGWVSTRDKLNKGVSHETVTCPCADDQCVAPGCPSLAGAPYRRG